MLFPSFCPYQGILRFISLDDSDLRRLAKKFRSNIQAQGANEKAYRKAFSKFAASGGTQISRDKLHEAVQESFLISLNERELEELLRYLDIDGDGEVSQDDFLLFIKHSGEHVDEKGGQHLATTIVDLAVSRNAQQEAALAAMGYQMGEVREVELSHSRSIHSSS